MNYPKWTLSDKKILKGLCEQGYNIKTIHEKMRAMGKEFNYDAIRREVLAGLTEQQIQEKRYFKYSINRSYEKVIGKDAIDYIKENRNE